MEIANYNFYISGARMEFIRLCSIEIRFFKELYVVLKVYFSILLSNFFKTKHGRKKSCYLLLNSRGAHVQFCQNFEDL